MRRTVNKAEAGRSQSRFLLLPAVICLFLLNGCVAAELNERSIVSMVGLDRAEGGRLQITLGLLDSQTKDNKSEEKVNVYSSEGETLYEAVRKLISVTGNKPLWTYIKIVVIGPSVSGRDMTSMLDFFNRNNEIQPNPFIVLSQIPAKEMINRPMELPALPTLAIERQIKNQNLIGTAPQVTLYQWNEMLLSPVKCGYASLIKTVKQHDHLLPQVDGMAVVKNGKMAGELNGSETRGVLWLKQEVKGGVIVVPGRGPDGEEQGKISLTIDKKNNASIEPLLRGSDIMATVDIEASLSIGEVLGRGPVFSSGLAEVRQLAEDQIKEEVEASLETVQKKWKADIYGFHQAVRRKYPDYWNRVDENWDEVFAAMPIEVRVKTDIKKFGLLDPFQGK